MFAVIVGCSDVSYYLAGSLLTTGHEVVIVERQRERCRLLNDELGGIAFRGDGTDENVLRHAGLARADVLIATTGRDETNLVVCQITKRLFHTPRIITVIKDPRNEPVFHLLGVDVVVNSHHLVLTNVEDGLPGRPLVHLKSLRAPSAELISVSIPSTASIVGMRLEDLELPPRNFISLVIKKDGARLPAHNLVLEAEDELLAVTMTGDEQTLYDIFTGET